MKEKNNKIKVSFNMHSVDNTKLKYISKLEFRDFSAQLNYIIHHFIRDYEKNNDLKNDDKYISLLDNLKKEQNNSI